MDCQSHLIKCPACGMECIERALYRYSVEQAAAHFCPISRNHERNQRLQAAIRHLWNGEYSEVYRCKHCGFGFGYPHIGGDETFYGILHEQKGYPTWRWDYDFAMREAISNLPGGRILDIGAGVGLFLRQLPGSWSLFAIESSDSNRRDLAGAQIEVIRDLAAAAVACNSQFQIVTMFQVLEHIAEFNPILKNCRELLSPSGRLVITVPDGDAMIRQEQLTGCADMPPNHINKWTPASLKLALEQNGFIVQKMVFEPRRLKCLLSAMHMRVMVDAQDPNSLAARIYSIADKRVRAPLVGCLGVASLLRLFPNLFELAKGGAFGVVAQRA